MSRARAGGWGGPLRPHVRLPLLRGRGGEALFDLLRVSFAAPCVNMAAARCRSQWPSGLPCPCYESNVAPQPPTAHAIYGPLSAIRCVSCSGPPGVNACISFVQSQGRIRHLYPTHVHTHIHSQAMQPPHIPHTFYSCICSLRVVSVCPNASLRDRGAKGLMQCERPPEVA